mgnify:CR=1 FL=1
MASGRVELEIVAVGKDRLSAVLKDVDGSLKRSQRNAKNLADVLVGLKAAMAGGVRMIDARHEQAASQCRRCDRQCVPKADIDKVIIGAM